MGLLEKYVQNNITVSVDPIVATGILSVDFIIQAPGYPFRYLSFNDMTYKGEVINDETKLDIDAIGLKEIPADEEWLEEGATKLIVIPKGTKVELIFDPKYYDNYDQMFKTVIIGYNGIKIYALVCEELNDFIESIE